MDCLAGYSKNAPTKDYSINGSAQNRVFRSFNAISIIATTFGNGIVPEIQVFQFFLLFSFVKKNENKKKVTKSIVFEQYLIK